MMSSLCLILVLLAIHQHRPEAASLRSQPEDVVVIIDGTAGQQDPFHNGVDDPSDLTIYGGSSAHEPEPDPGRDPSLVRVRYRQDSTGFESGSIRHSTFERDPFFAGTYQQENTGLESGSVRDSSFERDPNVFVSTYQRGYSGFDSDPDSSFGRVDTDLLGESNQLRNTGFESRPDSSFGRADADLLGASNQQGNTGFEPGFFRQDAGALLFGQARSIDDDPETGFGATSETGPVSANYRRSNPSDANYKRPNPSGANYKRRNLDGVNYRKENPSGANYQWGNPSGVNYQREDPSGVNYQRRNPDGADYQRRNLDGANYQWGNPSGANSYQRENPSGADYQRPNLDGANYSGANYQRGNIVGANRLGSNLRGVFMRGSKPSAVDAAGTKLIGAEMRQATFGPGAFYKTGQDPAVSQFETEQSSFFPGFDYFGTNDLGQRGKMNVGMTGKMCAELEHTGVETIPDVCLQLQKPGPLILTDFYQTA